MKKRIKEELKKQDKMKKTVKYVKKEEKQDILKGEDKII